MASLLKKIVEYHDYISYDYPGINRVFLEYPLTGSFIPTLTIVIFYIYFCKVLGPKFMKNRQPYDLRRVMLAYNIFQVLVNLYLFFHGTFGFIKGWMNGINLMCFVKNDAVNVNVEPEVFYSSLHTVQRISYVYFLVKISDLLDTVFMILKKNFHQVSVLHLYHHASMPIIVGYCCKYLPFTQSSHSAYPNIFVHIFVYGYYLVTTYVPEVKKSIKVKKCITILQLCQFVYVLAMVILIGNQEHCPISMLLSYLMSFQAIMMIFMFSNFYYQTYIVRAKKMN